MEYEKDELELLEAIESDKVKKVSFDNEKLKKIATQTLNYLDEKKQISINIKRADLEYIKQKANDIGIPYQSIIQSLVHNYRTKKLKLEL